MTQRLAQRSLHWNWGKRLREGLESRYCAPSFGGCVLAGIALAFFGAALNTMSGWLYVLSGMIISLLLIAAVLCLRSLRNLKIRRLPIHPVTVGQELALELILHNPTKQTKEFFQILDLLPVSFTGATQYPITQIEPKSEIRHRYSVTPERRGIFHWDDILLRTGNPLGLFWCSRKHNLPTRAIIYPQILSLSQCPIIDTLGRDDSLREMSDRSFQAAQEGVTKALRPYRFGDPTRLIHWRTSARFNEFKVRELEVITGGQEIVIGLDTTNTWREEDFEKAVTAAASLYSYASRLQMNVKLWTDNTGLVTGFQRVLEALAAVEAEAETLSWSGFSGTIVWLTQNPASIHALPPGSSWIFWTHPHLGPQSLHTSLKGIIINAQNAIQLQQQLQTQGSRLA